MFRIIPNQFPTNPTLVNPVLEGEVLTLPMSYFDRDGYELNALEQAYYHTNGIPLNSHLNHVACQLDWIEHTEEPTTGAILDHSILLVRYDYSGEAKEQLKSVMDKRPIVGKLLRARRKWGIDFSLDWVTEDDVCGLLHIEFDRYYAEGAIGMKERIEKFVLNTDFADAYKQIVKQRSYWQYLVSDDQDDWKAKFFGFERAFDNRKTY